MKGLLLKDFYMMQKYCRSYLFISLIFIAASIISNGNLFFVFYPCLLCGMIPVTFIAYDEKSRWQQYSAAFPCTKAQIVSAKYLIGLITQTAMIVLSIAVHAIKQLITDSFSGGDIAVLLLLMVIISAFSSSVSLPFIFKFGAEKGRTAYYVLVGSVCGASVLASSLMRDHFNMNIELGKLLAVITVFALLIYVLSWYLSITFYKKREF